MADGRCDIGTGETIMIRSILLGIIAMALVPCAASATNQENGLRADHSGHLGHFYTILGYEVVTAPDNFFYTHGYNSYQQPTGFGVFVNEPFTHTGTLASDSGTSGSVEYYGGYTLGWDTGYESLGEPAPGATFDQSKPIGTAFLIKDYLWLDLRSSEIPTGEGDPADDALFQEFANALEYGQNLGMPNASVRNGNQRYRGTTLLLDGTTYSVEGGFRRYLEETEVPVLSKIPFLCQYFAGQVFSNERMHLLIYLTPQLVNPVDCE